MAPLPDYSPTIEIHIAGAVCDGCGLCVDFCPVGVLEMNDGLPNIVKLKACYACDTCEDLCPQGAIKVEPITSEAGKQKTEDREQIRGRKSEGDNPVSSKE